MSVFGGDSWSREEQYRKRRVDDMVVEGLDGSSSYKKLSSGKYACLVCPHNPVLDTPLMLSMHIKGSRHRAAESRLKEKQLVIQDEMNKRIALSERSAGSGESSTSTLVNQQCRLARKPLIEQTRRVALEILRHNGNPQRSEARGNNDNNSHKEHYADGAFHHNDGFTLAIEAAGNLVAQRKSDLRERQERELKFTAAGWKRDGHGKWYRDENVEFDSDEEDPNICLP